MLPSGSVANLTGTGTKMFDVATKLGDLKAQGSALAEKGAQFSQIQDALGLGKKPPLMPIEGGSARGRSRASKVSAPDVQVRNPQDEKFNELIQLILAGK